MTRIVYLVALVGTLAAVMLVQQPGVAQRGQQPQGRGLQIERGQECPPGMTEVRPGRCQTPEFPAPSIVDYRPRSTLVTDAHPVPKAKFPAVDIHAHPRLPLSSEALEPIVADMDRLNVRVLVHTQSGDSPDQLRQALRAIGGSRHKDRMVVFADVNFQGIGPGFGQRAAAQLEADVKSGALGLGEIPKGFGLSYKKTDGTRLKVDDAELDPIWETAARLNVPVFMHVAEPQEFFQPIDFKNERWLELALFGDRRYPPDLFPRFDDLMLERNHLIQKHPKTRFILAHFGWHANDLARAGKLLDSAPNVFLDVAAVLYDFGRQPRAAREFFVKYQDRILFGKDFWAPEEYPSYWRVFETRDEYFDYYRNYHAFWKLYGLDLPDEVLKKLYYQNALKVVPGLPKTGWPPG
jgi:predicted TIM-barrel fold metal-dependent hydrolase